MTGPPAARPGATRPPSTGLRAELGRRLGGLTLRLALEVAAGEVVVLLGPNGAGKSTALRLLAGLLRLESGRIEVAGRTLADAAADLHLPPHQRSVGMVFQDYLLFPHLTVLDNVAFGLAARGVSRAEARRRARPWLQRVGLADRARERPRELSGGQAQRVALARALAPRPDLLLLDEPLAALDARTRLLVRTEVRRELANYPGPAVVVTHDPVDAAVLGDRLLVMEAGRLVQEGSPAELARRPRTDYVARLVGLNLLAGEAEERLVRLPGGGTVQLAQQASGPVHAAFRPAAVSLFLHRPDGSPRNLWIGRISTVEPHGEGVRVQVAGVPGPGQSVLAEVTAAAVAELGLAPGREVWAAVKATDIDVYPRGR